MMATGCSLVRGNENFNKSDLKEQTDSFIESWFAADFKGTIDTYKDQMDDDTLALYKQYAKQKKTYQGVKEIIKTEYTITTDSATVTETILCENGSKITFGVTYDEDGNIATDDSGNYSLKIEAYKTLTQKMKKAALNTVMSMAIVFCVLIFISLIISCFKFIGAIGQKKDTAPKTEQVAKAPVSTPQPQENLVDDLELVAVITAAIAAAEETQSADGLVVRSIIRRGA
jgi:sodium pump decarboxylase gamma subunit